MKHFTINDIETLDRIYRANLMNSITGLKPVNLIGTISEIGITNVAIFSSVIHLGANPALIGFIQRPITELSHTYKNIIQNGFFTINQVPQNYIEQAHQTSAKYENNISEFDSCNFTETFIEDFKAPFVQESVIKIGLQLVQQIPIALNNTTLIIGKVEHLIIKEELISTDGVVDLAKATATVVGGLDTYYSVDHLTKLKYAKV